MCNSPVTNVSLEKLGTEKYLWMVYTIFLKDWKKIQLPLYKINQLLSCVTFKNCICCCGHASQISSSILFSARVARHRCLQSAQGLATLTDNTLPKCLHTRPWYTSTCHHILSPPSSPHRTAALTLTSYRPAKRNTPRSSRPIASVARVNSLSCGWHGSGWFRKWQAEL